MVTMELKQQLAEDIAESCETTDDELPEIPFYFNVTKYLLDFVNLSNKEQ